MSLVDQYDDRVFSNGRVMGGKYNEMSGKTDYFDVSPFTRKAGAGIGLDPDVVIYMGKAAQGMPQDEGMDRRIAEGMLNAIARTLEYVPGRDDSSPRTLEYVPGRDDSGVQLL